jgi:putative transposase
LSGSAPGFVDEHRGAYGVKRLCRVVGVARSGFYAWAARPPSARATRDQELIAVILEVHACSRRTYGAPRVHAKLRRLDQHCSRKRVARLRSHALVGVHARRRWRWGRPDVAPAPDLVNRDFMPSGPDQVWAVDVTQFRTHEGWLHLAAVVDLWSRRIVGWSMSASPNSELVTDALLMAFQRRRPDRRVVHHSDRGAAYTSLAFSQRVRELELDQSFGSNGDCYDNAAVEAFWATFKREVGWIHNTTTWPNRAELRSALFDYIEGFYNPNRIQRRLGHQSPADYEQHSAA